MAKTADIEVTAVVRVEAAKCIGLFGWVFGHKYFKNTADYVYRSDHCYRCGLPKGSVKEKE